MFYFTISGDVVISHAGRRLITEENAIKYVSEKNPGTSVQVISPMVGTLYFKCKKLSEVVEDYDPDGWFISEDEDSARAGAIISAVDKNKLWRIMLTEEEFMKWVNRNVR